MLFGVAFFVVGLLVSIAVHELGHMLVAKAAGGRVSEFMVGFGPKVFSFVRGTTRYGLKAIPFGGYVRILGMRPRVPGEPAETAFEAAVPGRDFHELPAWRRTATLLAGPLTNIVLATVLVAVTVSLIGVPSTTNRVGIVRTCLLEEPCGAGTERSPAARAGVEPGDRVVAVDGRPTPTWESVAAAIAGAGAGSEIVFTLESPDGTVREARTTTVARPADGAAIVGIGPAVETLRRSPAEVPALVLGQTGAIVRAIAGFPVRVLGTFSDSLTGAERDLDGPVGLVGVGRIGAQIGDAPAPLVVRTGQLMLLLAGLNVSLGVFNLVPLLPLDGGHIAVTWFETARSRWSRRRGREDPGPVDIRRLMPVTNLVVVFFVVSSLLLVFADVTNPIRLP